MANFFHSALFTNFLLPILTIFLAIWVKVTSKEDHRCKMTREDWFIGFELSLIALFVYVTYLASASDKIEWVARLLAQPKSITKEQQITLQNSLEALKNLQITGPWFLVSIIISLWGASHFVRKWGWEKGADPVLRIDRGIIFPIAYGLALIAIVFFMTKDTSQAALSINK